MLEDAKAVDAESSTDNIEKSDRDRTSGNESHSDEPSDLNRPGFSSPCATTVVLLATCAFFGATGHQAALSNIRWNAAFVGFAQTERHFFTQALLLLLNTFAGPFLAFAALPLFAIRFSHL